MRAPSRPDLRAVRVLSVITRLGKGGAERRLHDVLGAIPAEHTLLVGRDSDDDVVAEMEERHEVVRLDSLVRSLDQKRDPRALADLTRLMRARHFDVVHTHHAKGGLLGRVAARAASVPLVYHSASGASFGPGYARKQSELFALAERVTAPLVDRYFVVGVDLARRLVANGVAPGRIEVVRSSLDLRPFRPPAPAERAARRAEHGIDEATPVVCYVGRLEHDKGVGTLPAMLAGEAGPEGAVLLVAGDGPLRDQLAAEGARAGAPRVVLLGHVDDVGAVMRCADVLALPSRSEGLPQVLVQAARSGLPFVAYDVDGVGELRGAGAVGDVVPVHDRTAFAAALRARLAEAPGTRREAVAASVWRAWDAGEVAARYRRRYEADLGRPLVAG